MGKLFLAAIAATSSIGLTSSSSTYGGAGISYANAFCPENFPAAIAGLTQDYDGTSQYSKWVISPTAKINVAPDDAIGRCGQAGFMTQFLQDGPCLVAFLYHKYPALAETDRCTYYFSDGGTRLLTMALHCDPAAKPIRPDRIMTVVNDGPDATGTGYYINITGTSSAVCDPITAAPTVPGESTTAAAKVPQKWAGVRIRAEDAIVKRKLPDGSTKNYFKNAAPSSPKP